MTVKGPQGAPPVPLAKGDTPQQAKVRKAAVEFEAVLMGNLLRSFEHSLATVPGGEERSGEDNYQYLAAQAVAQQLAQSGALGISAMLCRHLMASPHPTSVPGAEAKLPPQNADITVGRVPPI